MNHFSYSSVCAAAVFAGFVPVWTFLQYILQIYTRERKYSRDPFPSLPVGASNSFDKFIKSWEEVQRSICAEGGTAVDLGYTGTRR